MTSKTNNIILLIILTALSIFPDISDIPSGLSDLKGENGGQTVAKFITIPISARQLALGGLASVPDDHAATAVYSSPATSAYFSKYQFAITHNEWTWGLRKEYLGANFPLLDWGTAGISAQMFTLGKFENARDIDENPSDPKFIEYMITASYAKQIIHKRLAIGGNISYLESRLDGTAGRALSSCLDAVLKVNSIFRAGFYIRNFGTPLVYNNTKEDQPFQMGLNVRLEPVPQGKRINHRGTDLKFTLGALKTIDEPLEIATGLEFRPIKQFAIRTGYDYFLGINKGYAGLSAGLGLDVKKYGVDAGIKFQSKDFAPVWGASIRYHTEEIVPKTAEDYFKVAARYFKRDKYKTAINYAQKALYLNPNMWKAHSLISKAIASMHRDAGTEIALIYTANINSQYSSIAANGYKLGGLSRHLTKIKETRKLFETSITVDAGNFIGGRTSRQKAEFSQSYLKAAGYDAFGIGKNEAEFASGRSGLSKKQFEYICTDCKFAKNIFTIDTLIVRKENYRIAILNICSPMSNKKGIQERALEIVRLTQTKDINDCDLRILMVDDNWENIRYYAQNIPLAEVIICNSLEQKFETPIKIRNSVILSPGQYGQHVGLLSLRFDKKKRLKSYVNTLIPITDEIEADPVIEKLVNGKPDTTLNNQLQEELTEELIRKTGRQGVFTFISDRHKTPGIFLKVIDKMAEFPLTDTSHLCSDPTLSFKNNSIIYRVASSDSSSYKLHKMSITGFNHDTVNFPGSVIEAKYSHDHKWLYASIVDTSTQKTNIYRIKPGAEEPFLIIDWKDGSEKDIAFSNDGENMVFTSDRDGKSQVYISDIMGTTPLRLTDAEAECIKPLFSTTNQQVAYLSDRGNLKNRKDLWVYDRVTGKTVRLTRDANVSQYQWYNSKGTILYTAGVNLVDMNTINIFTGLNKKLIVKEAKKDYSEKDARIISYKDKKYVLFTKEYTSGKREIWMCNLDGTNEKQAVLDNGNNWLK